MRGRAIATVVRVRAVHERIARAELAARRSGVDTERRRQDAARRAVAARRDGDGGAARFVGHRELLAGGVVEIHTAGIRLRGAEEAFSDARRSWQSASRELDGVERIAERMARADAEDDARRIANEIDDLVVMRHGARRPVGELR